MGWLEYSATCFDKNGNIDRRAECEKLIGDFYKVEKGLMVGRTYFAAVTKIKKDVNGVTMNIPKDEQVTFAAITLTWADNKKHLFAYKGMDESFGPSDIRCPESILDLLSPTDDKFAQEWRINCRRYNKQKKELSNLPIGSRIRVTLNNNEMILVKSAPHYQFKTWFWEIETINGVKVSYQYVKKSQIPLKYEIVSAVTH